MVYVTSHRICGQRRIHLQFESPLLVTNPLPRQFLTSYFDGFSTYRWAMNPVHRGKHARSIHSLVDGVANRTDSDVPWPYFPYEAQSSSELFETPVPFHERRTDASVAMVRVAAWRDGAMRCQWL
jgi:hypothetical protein